jgi:Holliday junction resolvase RusA-like endonuclease
MTYPSLTFTILGQPVAKGRPRGAQQGRGVRMYTPKRTRQYEARVAAAAREAAAEAGGWTVGARVPVRVEVHAIFDRPQRLYRVKDGHARRPHTRRPDLDNVVKAVLDGIDQTDIWTDDAQVVEIAAVKEYAAILDRAARICELPRVEVTIRVLPLLPDPKPPPPQPDAAECSAD